MKIKVSKIDNMLFQFKARSCPTLCLCLPVFYQCMTDRQQINNLAASYIDQCKKDYFHSAPIEIAFDNEKWVLLIK